MKQNALNLMNLMNSSMNTKVLISPMARVVQSDEFIAELEK